MIDRLKKNYFLLILTFLFIYFFFNLLDGERGLISYIEKKDLYERLKKDKNSLSNKIEDMINTVVRQIAFLEFEKILHNQRKNLNYQKRRFVKSG